MIKPIQFLCGAIASLFERKLSILVVLSIGSIATLISGGSFLEAFLVGGLPVGNVLAAAALCLSACVAIGLSRSHTVIRYFSVAALIAAFAWLPISIGLAGNLTLNFSGLRGQVWIWLSLTTIVVILFALGWATVDHLVRRRLHRRSEGVPAVSEYYDREQYWPQESLSRREAIREQIEVHKWGSD